LFFLHGLQHQKRRNLLGLGGGKKSVTVVVDPKTQSVVVATTSNSLPPLLVPLTWPLRGVSAAPIVSTQDCGSISAAGLYTAPATIPNPALVAVTATANANSRISALRPLPSSPRPPLPPPCFAALHFLLSGSDAEGLLPSVALSKPMVPPTPQRQDQYLP